MKQRILFIIFIIATNMLMPIHSLGVPAYPHKTKIVLSDKDSVYIYMKGDEHSKFATDEKGYTLLPDSNSWVYAKPDSNGYAIKSAFRITSDTNMSTETKEFLKAITPHIPMNAQKTSNLSKVILSAAANTARNPCIGNRKALVILMQYPNQKFIKKASDFDSLFNQNGYKTDNAKGSVRDYYRYTSYGKLDMTCDVYGPYTAQNMLSYYGANGTNGSDLHPEMLFEEALQNLPDSIDLSKYDYSNNGYLNNIHIIFAGYGEEAGAPSYTIWSHEARFYSPYVFRNFKIAEYSCSPELRSNSGSGISRIGVICHELAHSLGTNDYYDVDYADNGSYVGTGKWDIMAQGSWNNDGISPSNFNPYIKTHDFCWSPDSVLNKTTSISLQPSNTSNTFFRINTPVNNDYYLLENRRKENFDSYIPGNGLLIYHIHPSLEDSKSNNHINNKNPQLLYPICASSTVATPKSNGDYGDINSAGCPFPGTSGKHEFSSVSVPSPFCWDGTNPEFNLYDIMTDINNNITFQYSSNHSAEDIDSDYIYSESFEQGISNFVIEETNGSNTWTTFPFSYGFISSSQNFPSPYNAQKGLTLFDGQKKLLSICSITSPYIEISKNEKYEFSFHYQSCSEPYGAIPELNVYMRNEDNNWQKCATVSDTTSTWIKYRFDMPEGFNRVQYKLTGTVFTGGIFIDDIKIRKTSEATSIHNSTCSPASFVRLLNDGNVELSSKEKSDIYIYSLNGILLHKISLSNSISKQKLNSGIYIITDKKGRSVKISIP